MLSTGAVEKQVIVFHEINNSGWFMKRRFDADLLDICKAWLFAFYRRIKQRLLDGYTANNWLKPSWLQNKKCRWYIQVDMSVQLRSTVSPTDPTSVPYRVTKNCLVHFWNMWSCEPCINVWWLCGADTRKSRVLAWERNILPVDSETKGLRLRAIDEHRCHVVFDLKYIYRLL